MRPIVIQEPKAGKIVFFIKGGAAFILRYSGKEERGVQLYGESYQMFRFEVDPKVSAPVQAILSLKALGNTDEAYLVGPFVVSSDITLQKTRQ